MYTVYVHDMYISVLKMKSKQDFQNYFHFGSDKEMLHYFGIITYIIYNNIHVWSTQITKIVKIGIWYIPITLQILCSKIKT